MRSLFAALRSLVLPAGATTGPRIVLNGLAGRIEVYDVNGDLYATIDPVDGITSFVAGDPDTFVRLVTDLTGGPLILFGQNDADVNIPGFIQQYVDGAGGGRNLVMELNPGKFSGTFDGYIRITSESQDHTEPPAISLISAGGIITDTGGGANPRFALWSATGTLDGAGNVALAGTPITSSNVLMLQGRWTDAGGNSSEFGGGLIANNAGLIGNFGAPGGASRPYRITALYIP